MLPNPVSEGVLLPCPFCGSDETTSCANGDGGQWLSCRACMADGPYATSEAERDALWNTRTPSPSQAELVVMREAKHLKNIIVKAMVDLYSPTRMIGGPTFGQYADAIIATLSSKDREG